MNNRRIYQVLAALVVALGVAVLTVTGAAAVGLGKTCGGIKPVECDSGLFCQMRAGKCGVADGTGKCAKVPQVCPKHIRYVCGCDGKTYNNDCERQMAKVSKDHNGKCKGT